ncbi:histone-lysine N-methyltransferase SETMAR [Trichonephila clavipes]|nr:histone-lysine N-methyltransferase SETMAR [Trichonephila clavipes]
MFAKDLLIPDYFCSFIPPPSPNTSHREPTGKTVVMGKRIAKLMIGSQANYIQFWFRRFRSSIFDFKETPRTGRPVVENVDKITEIIEVDRHVSSRSIAQVLKIDHKTVLSHLRKVGFKKKLHVWCHTN